MQAKTDMKRKRKEKEKVTRLEGTDSV